MRLFEKIKGVIFDPEKFFEKMKKEEGIIEAFKYNLAISPIAAVMLGIVFALMMYFMMGSSVIFSGYPPAKTIGGGFSLTLLLLIVIGSVIGSYIMMIIGPFITAIIYHIFAIILGGKGGYDASYKTIVYSATPAIITSWIIPVFLLIYIFGIGTLGMMEMGFYSFLFQIPVMIMYSVMYIIGLYVIVLQVIGIYTLHDLNIFRSFGVIALTIIAIAVIMALLFIFLSALAYSFIGGIGMGSLI